MGQTFGHGTSLQKNEQIFRIEAHAFKIIINTSTDIGSYFELIGVSSELLADLSESMVKLLR